MDKYRYQRLILRVVVIIAVTALYLGAESSTQVGWATLVYITAGFALGVLFILP